MKLIIKPCDGMPCSLKTFTVSDIDADTNDFGYTNWENGKFYECKNYRFISYTTPKPEVLKNIVLMKQSLTVYAISYKTLYT